MSVQPFAEQGHYTPVHDAIFDVVMPKCPPNAWKVLCYIIRKTRGWNKEQDAIPYSQIREGTGISSKATVSGALKWLAAEGLVVRHVGRDKSGKQKVSSYCLNREYELYSGSENEPEPSTENEHGPATEIEPGPSTESKPLKNHTVPQEPENKKQVSPEGAETSSAAQKPNQNRPQPTDPSKGNFYVDMLKRGLDAARVPYSDRLKGKFAKRVGEKLKEGESQEVLIRATAHMISRIPDWPEMELADALNDVKRTTKQKSQSDNVTQIRSRKVDDEPPTEAEIRHRREDAELLERLRKENGIA